MLGVEVGVGHQVDAASHFALEVELRDRGRAEGLSEESAQREIGRRRPHQPQLRAQLIDRSAPDLMIPVVARADGRRDGRGQRQVVLREQRVVVDLMVPVESRVGRGAHVVELEVAASNQVIALPPAKIDLGDRPTLSPRISVANPKGSLPGSSPSGSFSLKYERCS